MSTGFFNFLKQFSGKSNRPSLIIFIVALLFSSCDETRQAATEEPIEKKEVIIPEEPVTKKEEVKKEEEVMPEEVIQQEEPVTQEEAVPPVDTTAFKGKASYYADKFQGRKTASGEIFDQAKLTAAHKTLPFNTRVEVLNPKNNKTVIVIINDRLPASSTRTIDLSYEAARQINMISEGILDVNIRVLTNE